MRSIVLGLVVALLVGCGIVNLVFAQNTGGGGSGPSVEGDKGKGAESPAPDDPAAARAKMVAELQDRFAKLEARRTALLDRMAAIETEQLPKTRDALDQYDAALTAAENRLPEIVAEVEAERAGWLAKNIAKLPEALRKFKEALLAPIPVAPAATPPNGDSGE